MNVLTINPTEAAAVFRIFQKSKHLFRRNREVPLRYCLLISPVLASVLIVGFLRYMYGRLMHQF